MLLVTSYQAFINNVQLWQCRCFGLLVLNSAAMWQRIAVHFKHLRGNSVNNQDYKICKNDYSLEIHVASSDIFNLDFKIFRNRCKTTDRARFKNIVVALFIMISFIADYTEVIDFARELPRLANQFLFMCERRSSFNLFNQRQAHLLCVKPNRYLPLQARLFYTKHNLTFKDIAGKQCKFVLNFALETTATDCNTIFIFIQ